MCCIHISIYFSLLLTLPIGVSSAEGSFAWIRVTILFVCIHVARLEVRLQRRWFDDALTSVFSFPGKGHPCVDEDRMLWVTVCVCVILNI